MFPTIITNNVESIYWQTTVENAISPTCFGIYFVLYRYIRRLIAKPFEVGGTNENVSGIFSFREVINTS